MLYILYYIYSLYIIDLLDKLTVANTYFIHYFVGLKIKPNKAYLYGECFTKN